jgi:predicted nucleotide-binding protein (sugar kinase/HSP70/actin superfamily)
MSHDLKRKDLEAIFDWNAEFSTAFRDIRAEDATKAPYLKVAETISKSASENIKAMTEAFKALKETHQSESNSGGESPSPDE